MWDTNTNTDKESVDYRFEIVQYYGSKGQLYTFAEINENAWSITWCDVLLNSKDALFLVVVVVFAVYLAVFVKTSFVCTFSLTYFNKLDYGS